VRRGARRDAGAVAQGGELISGLVTNIHLVLAQSVGLLLCQP
jgi:hypothetical protein